MKTALNASAYRQLEEEYQINLGLTSEQVHELEEDKAILLSEEQLNFIIDQLIESNGLENYLQNQVKDITPVSLSLFIINDNLWKMMKRKSWDTDKMLAMSIIPLCTWDQKEEKTSNPKGVKRWEIGQNSMYLLFDSEFKIRIKAEGGDFSGFIEQSQLAMRKFGMLESRKLVPNYSFEKLEIDVAMTRAQIKSNPTPRDDFDYDFSESARTFYEHGFAIIVPGEDVVLSVGKRKPCKMLGEAHIMVGIRTTKHENHYRALKMDIWSRALRRRNGG